MEKPCYSNDDEAFDWDDPQECLRDWFEATDEIEHPEVWRIYHGVEADVEALSEKMFCPTGFTDYLMAAGTTAGPEWIAKEQK